MNTYTFWKTLDSLSQGANSWSDGLLGLVTSPRVDVVVTKDHYELTAELPGFRSDEVTVQVKDGVLELSAGQPKTDGGNEAKAGTEPNAETQWLLRERRQTVLQRSFRLPRDVDGEAIQAAFHDGLLVLTLPKKEEAKPRVVTINAA